MLEKPFTPAVQVTFFSLYGAVGLVLATFIHVGSFGAMVLPADSGVFTLMHLGIFPLFFAFVLRAREWRQPREGWLDVRSAIPPRDLLAYFPWWAIVFVLALGGYTFVNFMLATGAATGHISTDGAQTLTEAQSVRAFSGHWMLFYAVPAVFFGFVPADARPSQAQHRSRTDPT